MSRWTPAVREALPTGVEWRTHLKFIVNFGASSPCATKHSTFWACLHASPHPFMTARSSRIVAESTLQRK